MSVHGSEGQALIAAGMEISQQLLKPIFRVVAEYGTLWQFKDAVGLIFAFKLLVPCQIPFVSIQ